MKTSARGSVLALLFILSVPWAGTGPYTELVPDFDRKTSSVMVRKVTRPTAADMDCAAYFKNPLRFDPDIQTPAKTPEKTEPANIQFGGLLTHTVNSIKKTPLSASERNLPMAWTPLQNHLWELTKDPVFADLTGNINGYKWEDPEIFKAYQEITAAYLHRGPKGSELWVQIDFSPWVSFLNNITDEDGDGYREIYGKLNLDSVKQQTWDKAVKWMRSDYLTKQLSAEQVQDWAQTLASYWYPSLNTDVMEVGKKWPDKSVEKDIRKTLGKFSVQNPTVVFRGNPLGKPIYNVFVVEGASGEVKTKAEAKSGTPKTLPKAKGSDATRARPPKPLEPSQNFSNINSFLDKQSQAHGGYIEWQQSLKAFRKEISDILEGLPSDQLALPGKENWLFFRRSWEYVLSDDLTAQKPGKNPLPHIVQMRNYFDSLGVSMLFVPVPTKSEVYYDKFSSSAPPTEWIHPYGRKFLKDLQSAGVEVIDLLPLFLEAKKEDSSEPEKIYQLQDTHWTTRGLVMAARAIAQRIKEYPWYTSLAKKTYSSRDTTTLRMGDIVSKLPTKKQKDFPAVDLKAIRVYDAAGKPYKSDKDAEIVLMGDSYTGVYELIDCKSAGVGAHISLNTGLPLDIITSWGGGPLVRQKLLRARKKQLKNKKLVIYMMTARDLYNYSQSWKSLKR